ncbi:hypothetical protein [Gimesia fumaroli]|uniref:Uncharacterized protein n=1 Tax=Gimesia fumaroli TaxID=2527976 RepID=A0A518I4Q7_9PLAN|nr:hypothetical protein [Gimesia fumaroli]QDV48101.1 hypothetical protein Enr17x_01100 [Gimesia fumaroli]
MSDFRFGFDARLFFQLISSSRAAWERQDLKCVARWSALDKTWHKVVGVVSKVGRICRTLSHNLRHPDALISLNLPQTSGFYGEQNHRERGIQYEIGAHSRATHATHHRAMRVAVKADFFITSQREWSLFKQVKRVFVLCAFNKKTEPLPANQGWLCFIQYRLSRNEVRYESPFYFS